MFLICFLVILTLETSVKCATGGGNGNENDPEDLSDRLQELKGPSDEQNTARSSARRQRRHNIRQSSAAASSTPEVPSQMDASGAPTEVQHDLRRAGQLSLQSRLDDLCFAEQTPKKHQKKSRNIKKRQVEAAKVGARRSTAVASSEPSELLPEEAAPIENRAPTGATNEPADETQATPSHASSCEPQPADSAQCKVAKSAMDRFTEIINTGLVSSLLRFVDLRQILQENFVRHKNNIMSAKKEKNQNNKLSQILKSCHLLNGIYANAQHHVTSVVNLRDLVETTNDLLKERPPAEDYRLHLPLDKDTPVELMARAVINFLEVTDVDREIHEFNKFINTELLSELKHCKTFFKEESSPENLQEHDASFKKQLERTFNDYKYTITTDHVIFIKNSAFKKSELVCMEMTVQCLCRAGKDLIALVPKKDDSDINFRNNLNILRQLLQFYVEQTETKYKEGTQYLNSASSIVEMAEQVGYYATNQVTVLGFEANGMWNVNTMRNNMKQQIGQIDAYFENIKKRAIKKVLGDVEQDVRRRGRRH